MINLAALTEALDSLDIESFRNENRRLSTELARAQRLLGIYAHVPVSVALQYEAQAIREDTTLSEQERDRLIARNALVA